MSKNVTGRIARLQFLVAIACILSGLLAGGDVYRYIIEVPSWRHLNLTGWAEYSRHADLGNGIILFPVEAIGSTIFLIAASILVLVNKSELRTVSIPVHIASFFALAGIVLTFFAAPLMLSLRTINNDPEFLRQVFTRFHFWGLLRAVAQVLSFFACVWAMGKVYKI
jgi:hypothetical protein